MGSTTRTKRRAATLGRCLLPLLLPLLAGNGSPAQDELGRHSRDYLQKPSKAARASTAQDVPDSKSRVRKACGFDPAPGTRWLG